MRGNRNERGVALLTVITALVALMVIAVPFAITMRLGYERSEATNARARAQHQVDSVLRFLEAYLVRTTERVEKENRANDVNALNNDPEADTQREIEPTLEEIASVLGMMPEELRDPYGTILGWRVDDENAKININSASFFAVANLLGMSLLANELEAGETTITVEDGDKFPDRGYVKIGRELIKYTGKDGNRLTGCERAMAANEPHHGRAGTYKAGHWVVNYAAWAIAYYPVARHPGEFTPFETLDVSDISRLSELDRDVPVLTEAKWEQVKPFFTANSRGELMDGWANVQPIVEGTSLPDQRPDYDRFNYAGSSAYYNMATVVRIEEKADKDDAGANTYDTKTARARRQDYEMVYSTNPAGRFENQMELFGKVHRKFDGNQARIYYRTRHPVNLNTAPRDVLIALFSHLRLKGPSQDRVTPDEAARVADEIIKRRTGDSPLRGFEDFELMLVDLQQKVRAISLHDHNAIFRNALNSNDYDLEFGTAPACFRTFDVYTLRAAATVSDRGGRLLAKRVATRVVEIGSQLTTSRVWETQRDFEEQLVASNDPRYWTTGPLNTGRFTRVVTEPWVRWPKMLQQHIFPWDPYESGAREDRAFRDTSARKTQLTTNGDFRLSPARHEYDNAPEDAREVEHFDFDQYIEGMNTTSGFSVPLDGDILNAISGDGVRPFAIELWWQAESTNDQTIFDVGESEFRNRVALTISGGDLILRVADNTTIERAVEIRYDLDELRFAADTWYHMHIVVAGAHPTQIALIVDGRAVGESNVLTHLQGSLTAEDAQLRVEDAEGFPGRGAVVIGTEVVEYESLSDNTIVVRTDNEGLPVGRGARGTGAREHPEGTPVVLLGYRRALVEDLRSGGATLDGDMGPWAVVHVDNNAGAQDDFSNYSPAVDGSNAIVVDEGDSEAGIDPTVLRLFTLPAQTGDISGFTVRPYGADAIDQGDTIEEQMQAFQEEGYCFVVFIGGTEEDFEDLDSLRSNVKHRVEFMRYQKSGDSASGLTLSRLDNNDGFETPPEPEDDFEILVGWRWEGGVVTVGGTQPVRMVVIPCSLKANGLTTEGYINPVNEDHIDHWPVQVVRTDGSERTLREWVRISEFQGDFMIQGKLDNPEILADTANWSDYDTDLIEGITNPPPATGGGGGDPGGGDPGGDPPGGGGGGGPGGGGDPGGGGGDPGGGGGDPGGGPNDDPGAPPADGGGGNPVPPDDVPPPGGDGPGGNPGGGDEPPPPSDDGPGGNPPGDDDVPPPPDDGGSGNPIPGDPPPPPDDGGGGSPIPPGDGGPPAPDPGGGGGDPEPGDNEDPNLDTDVPTDDDEPDPTGNGANSVVGVADTLRFRGVDEDRDQDGAVDDWPKGDDGLTESGAELVPVFATYGGPDNVTASPWYRPGDRDNITIATGDDQTRIGDPTDTISQSMDGDDQRLFSKSSTGLGNGDIEAFEYDWSVHLVAMSRSLNQRINKTENVDPVKVDQRKNTRLLCFPTGEMMDNLDALSTPIIGGNLRGEFSSCVIDEVSGDQRNLRFPLTLVDEELTETSDTIRVTSSEGVPNEADVPEGPGLLRIGEELAVFREAELDGNALEFRGVVRGVICTRPRNYEFGAPVEALFGVRVGILGEGVSESSNELVGEGFGRFPRVGVVRLEDPESESAELILYTENEQSLLRCPIGDKGAGIFRARYGTVARSWESNTAVFFQPYRYHDRFAEFSDHPEQSHWQFSCEHRDMFVKRVYWEEEELPPFQNYRVLLRLNEGAPWNATQREILFGSTDGDSANSGLSAEDRRREKGQNPLKFLRAYEVPDADNLINVQADKIEARLQCIFEEGAYKWKDLSANGWKGSVRITMFAIEYVNQNRVHRHVDR